MLAAPWDGGEEEEREGDAEWEAPRSSTSDATTNRCLWFDDSDGSDSDGDDFDFDFAAGGEADELDEGAWERCSVPLQS